MDKQENSNSLLMDDDQTHVVITGPPASRTVIDNLKKLLTQRQHSRESDAENKEVVPSTGSDLESELSFYSLLTSSTSDSDLDFLRTSPDNRKSKRRPKRNLSTSSSSSSSSLSPVRERRKRPKTSKRGVKRFDSQMIILEDWNPQGMTPKRTPSIGISRHSPISQLVDSADPLTNGANIVNINIMMNPNVKFNGDQENASSSNKESTTDEEDQGIASMDKSTKNGNSRGTRLRKTRRDRNKRRKHHHHHHHHHHHQHEQRDKPSPAKQLQLLPADLTESQGTIQSEDSTPAEAQQE
ncbi:unnamed protein product [Allacma fusca]|uniref:Uncharacterized protein n=1 Tax=Allacma fusca TaxID=39272 RepID=A0A8J2KGE2_9HEXA|nr:unnamed protein product [Allacma fusca]